MNRRRARWVREAVTGALAWERSIRACDRVRPFPFLLGRTDVERALLHKILLRRWNHLASGDPQAAAPLLEAALEALHRAQKMGAANQSVSSQRVLDFVLRSFRIELSLIRVQAAIRAAG